MTIAKLKAGQEWPFLGQAMQQAASGDRAGGDSGGREGGRNREGGDRAGDELLSLGTFMDEEDVEDAALQAAQEVALEGRFNALVEERGLEDEETLSAFFEFFNISIQLYRLNKLSGYLKVRARVCVALLPPPCVPASGAAQPGPF